MTTALQMIADKERRRRAQEKAPYAIALESFTYIDSSVGPVTIGRGELVYDIAHEAVVAHPEKFDIGPGKRRVRGSRPELNAPPHPTLTTTPTSVKKRDDVLRGPRWALPAGPGLLSAGAVERRSTTSPVTVRISPKTRDDICALAREVPSGYETGGLLIARRAFGGPVQLCEAWGPGPSSELRRDSMVLDWAYEHSCARDYYDATNGTLILAGFWHVHPSAYSRSPSEADLKMFGAAMRDASERVWPLRSFVGLIATSVDRLGGPELTAWVTRPIGLGQLICERAVIA